MMAFLKSLLTRNKHQKSQTVDAGQTSKQTSRKPHRFRRWPNAKLISNTVSSDTHADNRLQSISSLPHELPCLLPPVSADAIYLPLGLHETLTSESVSTETTTVQASGRDNIRIHCPASGACSVDLRIAKLRAERRQLDSDIEHVRRRSDHLATLHVLCGAVTDHIEDPAAFCNKQTSAISQSISPRSQASRSASNFLVVDTSSTVRVPLQNLPADPSGDDEERESQTHESTLEIVSNAEFETWLFAQQHLQSIEFTNVQRHYFLPFTAQFDAASVDCWLGGILDDGYNNIEDAYESWHLEATERLSQANARCWKWVDAILEDELVTTVFIDSHKLAAMVAEDNKVLFRTQRLGRGMGPPPRPAKC